jgi:hypothetical protein
MKNKLAGRLSLQEAIAQTLADTKEKLASAKGEVAKEVKPAKVVEEPVEAEKTASILDPQDPDQVEKLASALEFAAEKLAGDHVCMGGESHQGGEVLPVQAPASGKQPVSKAHATPKHVTPNKTGMISPKDNKGAATAVPTDDNRAPGGTGAKYPAKGVLKTGSAVDALQAAIDSKLAEKTAAPKAEEKKVEEKVEEAKEESALDYLLKKISGADMGGESHQGGETLSNTAPVPSNAGRQMIASNSAPKSATKREAKAPRKAELKQVLTEPALSAAHDDVVNKNLRNASKGGVKIAAARALLEKISQEGCQCGGDVTCRYCKMKTAAANLKSAAPQAV